MGANREVRAYYTALTGWAVMCGFWVLVGLPEVAMYCTPLIVTIMGFLYLGPRAMALGFGVRLPRRELTSTRWVTPLRSDHVMTYRTPTNMLVHEYRHLRYSHPIPRSHLDLKSCSLCVQEDIRLRRPRSHLTSPGEWIVQPVRPSPTTWIRK